MTSVSPVRLLAIALALTGVLALSAPSAAMAKDSCLDRILKDWFPDESIDGTYSQACYRAAERDLPQDLRDYSDLPAEIQRARLRDIRDSRVEPDQRFPQGIGGSGPVDDRNDDGGSASSGGPIDDLLEAAGPSSADSAPIPLLVLSGLALLLIAAGAAGLLARRVQARRARPGGPPPGPQV